MTSARKIAANRRNSRKSCGPRTAAGKAIASRNALRHGLAAVTHNAHGSRRPVGDIEYLAKALIGEDRDPLLFEQALVIAANNMTIRSINAQRIAVVERLKEVTAIALAKGDNSLAVAQETFDRSDTGDELDAIQEKHSSWIPDAPGEEDDWPIDLERASRELKERDEAEALEEAARDLIRLDRYHRRAWSRQKRAIRKFTNFKLMRALSVATDPWTVELDEL